jgi:putative spermidine/putrescine transport system permease protein
VGKGISRSDAALALVAALVALPFVPLVLWAFAGEWRFPDLLPTAWSLRGMGHLFEPGGGVLAAALNSLAIGAATGAVIFFVLLPIMVPPLASTMGLHVTFIRLGLADTLPGVFLVHLVPTVPYTALILAGVFAERTGELEEAARTLGANPWQAFLRVTLPGVLPGVAVAGLFAFLISWGQYVLTLLVGGGNVVTLPMLLFSAASGNDPVITSALALTFAVPAILALVLALRVLKPGQGTNIIGPGKV